MRVRMRIVRVRLCVLRVLAGGGPVSIMVKGLAAVGAVYCIAALIRMLGGM